MAKKLARVSILDAASGCYTTAAYLIAQSGKNYALPKDKRIGGSVLLDFALKAIGNLKYSVGGIMEFFVFPVFAINSLYVSSWIWLCTTGRGVT